MGIYMYRCISHGLSVTISLPNFFFNQCPCQLQVLSKGSVLQKLVVLIAFCTWMGTLTLNLSEEAALVEEVALVIKQQQLTRSGYIIWQFQKTLLVITIGETLAKKPRVQNQSPQCKTTTIIKNDASLLLRQKCWHMALAAITGLSRFSCCFLPLVLPPPIFL